MSATRRLVIRAVLAAWIGGSAPALAQTPGQAPAPPVPAPPPAQQAPTPPANYVYASEGRRDPFVNLVNRGTDASANAPKARVEGPAGLTTEELVVRGIVQSQGVWVAMVNGAAGKVFTIRTGQRLADGTVRTIAPQFLVIQQQVNDPMSPEKQREVRKFLRGGENK